MQPQVAMMIDIVAAQASSTFDNTALVAVLSLLGGSTVTAIVVNLFNRPKAKADTTKVLIDAYGELYDDIKEQVNRLEGRVESLEKERDTLRARVGDLIQQCFHWRNRSRQLESFIVVVMQQTLPADIVDHETFIKHIEGDRDLDGAYDRTPHEPG